MPFDFAALKIATRRIVHSTFGVAATYTAPITGVVTNFHVRWNNKQGQFTDGDSKAYAVVLEGVDRILFSADEIATPYTDENGVTWGGVTPVRLGIVTIPQYNATLTYKLDTKVPADGPINVAWNVASHGGN
jgi:hypothetical protein